MKKLTSLLMALIIILAGCGTSTSNEIGGTITVVVPFENAEEEFADVKEGFMAMYPEVDDIIFEGQETDFDNYISTRLTSGNYGDVLVIPFALTSTPEDLPAYLKSQGSYDEVSEKYSFADDAMYDNETYALPISVNSLGTIYNTSVLAKAGVTDFPTTNEEVYEMCDKVEKNTESICWYSNLNSMANLWGGALTSYGGENYEQEILDAGTIVNDGQPHREIFDFIHDMIIKEYTEKDIAAGELGESFSAVANGDVAFIIGASQMLKPIQSMSENPETIKIGGFPVAYDSDVVIPFGPDSLIGVANNSENSTTAQTFYDYLLSSESGYAFQNGGVSPELNENASYTLPDSLDYLNDYDFIRTIATSTPEVTTKYNEVSAKADMARIAQPIAEIVDLSVNDGDYDAYLAELEADFEAALEDE